MGVHEEKVSTHMVMLIQGPSQLGSDLNLYLQLLKEELEILWADEGVCTYDAKTGTYFAMKVVLLTMMEDYPVNGYNSGQVCHKNCACVR